MYILNYTCMYIPATPYRPIPAIGPSRSLRDPLSVLTHYITPSPEFDKLIGASFATRATRQLYGRMAYTDDDMEGGVYSAPPFPASGAWKSPSAALNGRSALPSRQRKSSDQLAQTFEILRERDLLIGEFSIAENRRSH